MPTKDSLFEKIDFAVLLEGSFNPEIFQPYWFKETGVLSKKEFEEVEVKIITRDITVLKSKFFSLKVSKSEFYIEIGDYAFIEILIETIRAIFVHLSQQPVSKLELRTDVHYSLKDEKSRDNIYQAISNYSIWDGIFENPKVKHVIIADKEVDGKQNSIQVSNCISNPKHIQIYGITHCDLGKIFDSKKEDVRANVLDKYLNMDLIDENVNFSVNAFLKLLND